DAILASEAGYHEPRAGEVYTLGHLRIEVVHPQQVTGDFNNGSIVMRLVYGDVEVLLTGDAEASAEHEMIARGHDLSADILHVGHHGSSTSTSPEFLAAVNPKVAIYSAGKDNPYGHPHAEVIERLHRRGVKIYGTDLHGTIRVTTDGKSFEITSERMPQDRRSSMPRRGLRAALPARSTLTAPRWKSLCKSSTSARPGPRKSSKRGPSQALT